MKGMIITGVILLAVGLAAFLGMLDFTQKEKVLDIGKVEISAEKKKTVPQWAGIVAMVAGGALVVAGATRKR